MQTCWCDTSGSTTETVSLFWDLVQRCDQMHPLDHSSMFLRVVNVRVSPSVFQLETEINCSRLSIQWRKKQWSAKGHQRPLCSVFSRKAGQEVPPGWWRVLRGTLREPQGGTTIPRSYPKAIASPLQCRLKMEWEVLQLQACCLGASARHWLCHRRRGEPFALAPATTQLAHAGPFRCAWAPTLEED